MSTDDMHDDAEFERFLAGDGELSRRLKDLPQGEPSAQLDAVVLAAIEGAMTAEKVQTVALQGAANDPIGPPGIVGQRKRSLASYWHWPVGFAAGILLTLAYRMGYQSPEQPPKAVAMSDAPVSVAVKLPAAIASLPESRVIALPPRAVAPAIVVPEAPSVPAVAARPSFAAPPAVAVTSTAAPRVEKETASPVQVVTARDVARQPEHRVAEAAQDKPAHDGPSGMEQAWGRDPEHEKKQSIDAHAAAPSAPALAAAPASAAPPPTVADLAAAPPPPAPSPAIVLARSAPAPAADEAPPKADYAAKTAARTMAPAAIAPSPPAKPDANIVEPGVWLKAIEKKLKDHADDAALDEWEKFRQAYPDYPVKPKFNAKLQALEAARKAKQAAGQN